MTQEEYQYVLNAIMNAETDVNDQYKRVGDASSTLCDINNTVNQINNMTVVYNRGGDVIGYDYIYTTPDIPDPSIIGVDSNTDNGWYATGGGGSSGGGGAGRGRRNASTSKYSGGVNTDSQSTDKMNGSGLVSGVVSSAWAGVSALAKLGKQVTSEAGEALATLAENFGTTFGDFCQDMGDTTADAIRVLFGVDSQGNTSMYIDEDTIGALAIIGKDNGFFNTSYSEATDFTPKSNDWAMVGRWTATYPITIYPATPTTTRFIRNGNDTIIYDVKVTTAEYMILPNSADGNVGTNHTNHYFPIYVSKTPFYYTYDSYNYSGQYVETVTINVNSPILTIDGQPYYCNTPSTDNNVKYFAGYTPNYINTNNVGNYIRIVYGNDSISGGGGTLPGVSDQTGATIPVDAITGADPHVVAQNLATQYPAVMGSPVSIVVMDDSCNEKTINYYAVPIPYSPTDLTVNVPVTGNTQVDIAFNPNMELPDIDMGNFMTQVINQLQGTGAGEDVVNTEPDPVTGEEVEAPLPTEPPATGTGNTPAWLPDDVVGNTVLWHVYNATPAQLNQFGYWLWVSGDIITQFKRIVSNPIDAILGLHKVYVTPNRGSPTTIVCGNLDSEVSAFPVTNQYSEINCGDVWITEYFGNVYDYSPYTDISVYLPFIGIVPVSVDDVMRGKMSIHYMVDVYTGACIAEISINRDGVGGVLYQFNGNCAVEYPITSMSYNNAIMATIGITSGAISAIPQMASGNVIGAGASMAGALLHSTMQQRETIQRSGSFSGNAGAMGAKKPYVIITRPQPEIAENYEDYEGYGANATVEIGNCSGYIKCRTVDLEISGAYKSELDEIEALLKGGVYI